MPTAELLSELRATCEKHGAQVVWVNDAFEEQGGLIFEIALTKEWLDKYAGTISATGQ